MADSMHGVWGAARQALRGGGGSRVMQASSEKQGVSSNLPPARMRESTQSPESSRGKEGETEILKVGKNQ